MKILFYISYLLFSTLSVSAYTRNVYDSNVKFRENRENRENRELRSYPVKRRVHNYYRQYGLQPYEKHFNAEFNRQDQRFKRLDGSALTGLNYEQDEGGILRNVKIIKRDLDDQQSKEPYGLVYRKGKLLGVLEPYQEVSDISEHSDGHETNEDNSYSGIQSEEDSQYISNRMSQLEDEVDDSEKDESSQSELAQYTNDKYPMVLASFKITKRLNALNANKRKDDKVKLKHSKRDKFNSEISSDVKEVEKKSVSNVENDPKVRSGTSELHNGHSAEEADAIEDDLRKILDDMGLIENDLIKDKRNVNPQADVEKRDLNNEDENLEEGFNKIDIVKATHDPEESDRKKREKQENVDKEQIKREMPLPKVQNYQKEGEMYIRNKRNEAMTDNIDIMKGLEKSGDLTVSGNKSPLASSENKSKTTEKRKNSEPGPNLSEANEDYERRLEQNIQEKINAIKEEVKREIASLQARSRKGAETQRSKRDDTSTFLEEQKSTDALGRPQDSFVSYERSKRTSDTGKSYKRSKRVAEEYANSDYVVSADALRDNSFGENFNNDYNLKQKRSLETTKTSEGLNKVDVPASVIQADSDKVTGEKIENADETSKEKRSPTTISNAISSEVENQDANEPVRMQRKRRQSYFLLENPIIIHKRKKRGEAVIPDGISAYLPYRAEDEEVDEEGDEFDDDGFDDRSAESHKRDINSGEEYESGFDYDTSSNYEGNQKFPARKYVANLDSDVYEHPLHESMANRYRYYDPTAYIRKKRHSFDQLVALHGGGSTLHRLSAVRNRNVRNSEGESRPTRRLHKKTVKDVSEDSNDENDMSGLSDTDLFGALPQSYEGEHSRSKRVKRSALKDVH